MRYPDGGGLSAQGRARREKLRLQAAQMFEQGISRCRWPAAAGQHQVGVPVAAALASRRPGGADVQGAGRGGVPAGLAAVDPAAGRAGSRPGGLRLGRGPAVDAGPGHGADRPAVPPSYTLRGTSCLLHRMGFSPQVPVHRAAERDEAVIAAWRTGTWAKVRG